MKGINVQKKTLAMLEAWLSNKENSIVQLAAHLGYRSTSVISMWIRRGNIPIYQEDRVLTFILRSLNEFIENGDNRKD